MEFPLSHFNVLILGLSGSLDNLSSEQEVKTSIKKYALWLMGKAVHFSALIIVVNIIIVLHKKEWH